MVQAVRNIVIVGGGTAGWLTAGVIAAKHRTRMGNGFSVTLVESPNTPIIGVGEGTWPTLRSTLARIGVSETELFRQCDAAFKQGARFARWTTGAEDDFYYHPLMLPQSFGQVNLVPHWLAREDGRSFCDAVCPQGRLCDDGLAPKTITTAEFDAVANYSYHLDAGKFAPFLQAHCCDKLGVRHVLADVRSVNLTESGDIRSIDSGLDCCRVIRCIVAHSAEPGLDVEDGHVASRAGVSGVTPRGVVLVYVVVEIGQPRNQKRSPSIRLRRI